MAEFYSMEGHLVYYMQTSQLTALTMSRESQPQGHWAEPLGTDTGQRPDTTHIALQWQKDIIFVPDKVKGIKKKIFLKGCRHYYVNIPIVFQI